MTGGAVDPGGLQSWGPLVGPTAAFVVVVAVLALAGRRAGERDPLCWISRGLERATGIPGWAAAMVGTASFGLLIAGIGFYNDVAWHVAIGRDEELLTPPHIMIVLGLQLFVVAGAVGIFFATLDRWPGGVRFRGLHVPRSAAAMLLVGTLALSGFPLDELWHAQFGIDVTMWSPTHLLMIVGASVTPLVSWLALAEVGVRPGDSWKARAVHVLVALLMLDGLSSVQGEFDFGVPQFQALYSPVLVSLAAGLVFTAVRLAHGPGWSVAVAVLFTATRLGLGGDTGSLDLDVRPAAVYVGSALVVEMVAWWLGAARRARLALASGAGVGTLGLATEWAWNQGAHQAWTSALLPDAVVLGVLAAGGAAVVGASLGDVARLREVRIPPRVLALGGLAVLLALAWPAPRGTGDVTASIRIERTGDGRAHVTGVVNPADAADGARWFQASAWQGGGLVAVDMTELESGVWRSEAPVPIAAPWKTLLRLHRGAEMMAIPIALPADPEIEGPRGEAFPAVDKVAAFEQESRYLLREQTEGGSVLYAWGIPALVLVFAGAVAASFVWSAMGRARTTVEPAPGRVSIQS